MHNIGTRRSARLVERIVLSHPKSALGEMVAAVPVTVINSLTSAGLRAFSKSQGG